MDGRHFTASPTVLVAATSRLISAIRTTDEPADIYDDYFRRDATILFDRPRNIETAGLFRERLLWRLAQSTLTDAIISCDGRTGVTSGTLPADEMTDAYDLVWKQDSKGEWRIAAFVTPSRGSGDAQDGAFIRSLTAGCDAPDDSPMVAEGAGVATGRSSDGSLYWEMHHAADAAPRFILGAWDGDEWVTRD